MFPGERHKKLLEDICQEHEYPELEATDVVLGRFPNDGTYLVRELPSHVLTNEMPSEITWRPGEAKKFEKWLEKHYMSCYLSLGQLKWYDFDRQTLFFDLVRIEVESGKIVDYKIIEVDGEQHFGPVRFSKYTDSKRVFSDTVIGDYMRDALFPGKVEHIDATANPSRLSEYILRAINT